LAAYARLFFKKSGYLQEFGHTVDGSGHFDKYSMLIRDTMPWNVICAALVLFALGVELYYAIQLYQKRKQPI
jgi:hypothetical protein